MQLESASVPGWHAVRSHAAQPVFCFTPEPCAWPLNAKCAALTFPFQPSQGKCMRNNSSNTINTHSTLVATLQARTIGLKNLSHVLSLKKSKPMAPLPAALKLSCPLSSSVPKFCCKLTTGLWQFQGTSKPTSCPEHPGQRGITWETQPKGHRPSSSPLEQGHKALAISLSSLYKRNTLLNAEPHSRGFPSTKAAPKASCSTARSYLTKTTYF